MTVLFGIPARETKAEAEERISKVPGVFWTFGKVLFLFFAGQEMVKWVKTEPTGSSWDEKAFTFCCWKGLFG